MSPHAGFVGFFGTPAGGGAIIKMKNKLNMVLKTNFLCDHLDRCALEFCFYLQGYGSIHWHAHAGWLVASLQGPQLLHAVPQHLIGCNEHDADDKGHGKSTDETLPHTRLTVLLRGVNWKGK